MHNIYLHPLFIPFNVYVFHNKYIGVIEKLSFLLQEYSTYSSQCFFFQSDRAYLSGSEASCFKKKNLFVGDKYKKIKEDLNKFQFPKYDHPKVVSKYDQEKKFPNNAL